MKDIDFDELDRAVGSALGGKKTDDKAPEAKAAKLQTQSDEAVVTVPQTTPPSASVTDDSTPAADTPSKTAKKSATSSGTARPTPALRRNSGRFMDVVHPSSDMKTTSPLSKTRTVIAPLSSSDTEAAPPTPEETPTEEPAVTPPAAEPDTTPEATDPTPVVTAPPAEDVAALGAEIAPVTPTEPFWPDPLDVMGTSDDTVAAPDEQPAADQPVELPTDTSVPAVEGIETGQTPFLSDAKVDKRPLGAFGVPGAEEDISAVDVTLPVEQPGVSAEPEAATNVATPLPPELQPDAVEAESQEIAEELARESEEPPTPTPEPAKITPSPEPVLNQSISPQYRPSEESDADDHVTSSVFDTEQYHQPLLAAHSGGSRAKRAIVTVLMVLLLLAVGAGIGYAAYLYSISS